MSLAFSELSMCPCCDHKTLQSNGAFLTCTNCDLAITSQALLKAVNYVQEAATLEQAIVATSN